MQLVLTGVNAFMAKTQKQKDRVKRKASDFVKAKARQVLRSAVLSTPQWSGFTASSWRLVAGKGELPKVSSVSGKYVYRENAKFKGDKGAWAIALEQNSDFFATVKYNSKITLTNIAKTAVPLHLGSGLEGPGYTPPGDRSHDQQLEFMKFKLPHLKDDIIPQGSLRPGNYIPGDVMAMAFLKARYRFLS